jgi:hypothetical protein
MTQTNVEQMNVEFYNIERMNVEWMNVKLSEHRTFTILNVKM